MKRAKAAAFLAALLMLVLSGRGALHPTRIKNWPSHGCPGQTRKIYGE